MHYVGCFLCVTHYSRYRPRQLVTPLWVQVSPRRVSEFPAQSGCRARLGINLRFLGDSGRKYAPHCLAMQEFSKLAGSSSLAPNAGNKRDAEKRLCFCSILMILTRLMQNAAQNVLNRRIARWNHPNDSAFDSRCDDSPARLHVMSIVHWTAVGHPKKGTHPAFEILI